MATHIEERVVSMKFDNKNFETNAKTTMSTLDKMDQKLNFKNGTKGIESIQKASNKMDFSAMSKAVDTINNKLSTMSVIGVTALSRITNAAIDAAKSITNMFFVAPRTDGFKEYELQINATQTILANTVKEGTNLQIVTKYLDELNTYADKTIYNFATMTDNIAKFTAAGVDLESSVNSIKGIANAAALGGVDPTRMARATYQISQALSAGYVALEDWNSIEDSGIGNAEFKDSLMETARVHGVEIDKMIAAEGSFRLTLQNRWLTADILSETLAKYAGTVDEVSLAEQGYTQEQIDGIMELGKRAEESATVIKTFTQLLGTLQEVVSSGWAQTWKILIGDFEEAKYLMTSMSDLFGGILGAQTEQRNNMLQGWKDLGGRTELLDALAQILTNVMNIVNRISTAFREVFPPTTSQELYNMTVGFREFVYFLSPTEAMLDGLQSIFKSFFGILKTGIDVVKTFIGVIFGLVGAINESFKIADLVALITGFVDGLLNAVQPAKDLGDTFWSLDDRIESTKQTLVEFITTIKEFALSIPFVENLKNIFVALTTAVKDFFSRFDVQDATDIFNSGIFVALVVFIRDFVKATDNIADSITGVLDAVRGSLEAWQKSLKYDAIMKIALSVLALAGAMVLLSTIDVDKIAPALLAVTGLLGGLMGSLKILSGLDLLAVKQYAAVSLIMISLASAIGLMSLALKSLGSMALGDLVKGLVGVAIALQIMLTAVNYLTKAGPKFTSAVWMMNIMSIAMLQLSVAMGVMALIPWDTFGKAAIVLGAMVVSIIALDKLAGQGAKAALQMITIASGMLILSGAIGLMALLPWGVFFEGMLKIAVALGAIMAVVGALGIAFKGNAGVIPNLLLLAIGITALILPITILGLIPWEIVAIGIGLLTGALLAIGGVAALLGLAAGPILAFSGAIAVLGVGLLLIGGAVALFATGMTALAAVSTVGATAITAALNAVAATIPIFAENLGNGIISFARVITKGAEPIGTAVITIILEILRILETAVPNIVASVGRILLAVITEIGNFIVSLIGRIPEWGKMIETSIRNFFGIDSEENLFFGIARSLIEGLYNGLVSGGAWLVEQVAGIFSPIIDKINNALGVQSPSWMTELTGYFVDVGLADGIKDNIPLVTDAVDEMTGEGAQAFYKMGNTFVNNFRAGLEGSTGGFDAGGFGDFRQQEKEIEEGVKRMNTRTDPRLKESGEDLVDAFDEGLKSGGGMSSKLEDEAEKLQQAIEDRTQEIKNSHGLFDAVAEREYVSGYNLLLNLQGQRLALEDFFKNLDTLSAKGVDARLVEEIRDMGISAADELSAVLKLTDQEIARYNDNYIKLMDFSSLQANKELGGNAITEAVAESLDVNTVDVTNAAQTMVAQTTTVLTDNKSAFFSAGAGLMDSFIEGIVSTQQRAVDAVKAVAAEISGGFTPVYAGVGGINTGGFSMGTTADLSNVVSSTNSRNDGGSSSSAQPTKPSGNTTNVIFNQTNTSPKALSATEIYRDTKSALNQVKDVWK